MKKAGSVLWGIVLIAAGVIWALNEFSNLPRPISVIAFKVIH